MENCKSYNVAPVLLLVFLLNIFAAVPSDAASIYGKVIRPPALTFPERAISRYRGGESQVNQDAGEDCVCNPGLFPVVYLTGENLPEIIPLDSIPVMAQKDKMFVPSVLAVGVGYSVGFPHLDPFFHNVFSYSKTKRFDLGRYPRGNSENVTFGKPGIVKVFCLIHYSMRAYVHVLETPYFGPSDEKGDFVIEHIQPGEYTLNVWQENQTDISQPITINSDSTYIEIDQ